MDQKDLHRDAAARNETIAQSLPLNTPSGVAEPLYDWAIIIRFYAAVRYVNALIASSGQKRPNRHSERERFMRKDRRTQWVVRIYGQLKSRSRRARYDAHPSEFSQADVDRSEWELEQIKRVILPLI
jgi:hypothetical protein